MNNCPKCGSEIRPGARFCIYCGAQLAATSGASSCVQPTAGNSGDGRSAHGTPCIPPYYYYQPPYQQQSYSYSQPTPPAVQDSSSFGFGFLCFLFPIIGLILYGIWKEEYPLRAKSCATGAWISIILCSVIVLSFFGAILILLAITGAFAG
ncbi:MAG: zinc ribbon domain-containing protein [Clostridiales bacterium]|jgi:hypothetical protein|nr:zinc ribbon domain-containing protein [Clostridiales bacterium]